MGLLQITAFSFFYTNVNDILTSEDDVRVERYPGFLA